MLCQNEKNLYPKRLCFLLNIPENALCPLPLERLFCSGDRTGFTIKVIQGKLLSVGNLVHVRHTLCLAVSAGSSPYVPACISQATASHLALFCFPRADERGKDVAWGSWGRM